MSKAAATATNRFDLAALDVLLGPQGFISVLKQDPSTGIQRYAALSRDSFEHDTLVRITASYALGFPGRGRRLYPLLTLDLRVLDGVATILCARRLGRLAEAAPLAHALMPLATTLAAGELPAHEQLAPFTPLPLLTALENASAAADFPHAGTDQEEKLPEQCWDYPTVLHDSATGPRIDPAALAIMLNLAAGERTQVVDMDPASGDYRVFHLGVTPASAGNETLTFELHRQGPGIQRQFFTALSLTLGPVGPDGLCQISAFSCESGADISELPRLIAKLVPIAATLQAKQRPDDALVLPFLSAPAQRLWSEPLPEGIAS